MPLFLLSCKSLFVWLIKTICFYDLGISLCYAAEFIIICDVCNIDVLQLYMQQ